MLAPKSPLKTRALEAVEEAPVASIEDVEPAVSVTTLATS